MPCSGNHVRFCKSAAGVTIQGNSIRAWSLYEMFRRDAATEFHGELTERVFVQIDSDRSAYMTTPEESAVSPIFGTDVANNFSSAMNDAWGAGLCFATLRNTACVFHCMRVLEKGLISLANGTSRSVRNPV
jgi:hypothetical protein